MPAGKYQAVVTRATDFDIDGTKVTWACWFVRDVGIVKKRVNVGKIEMVLELEKFEAAR